MWTFYLLKGNNSNTHEHKSIHRWKITSRGIRAFHKLLWDVAAWHEPARLLGDDGGADSLAVANLLVGVVCLWASLHWSGSTPEICIWSYLIPDNPVCTRGTSLAVMEAEKKAARFPETTLFVNFFKHMCVAHAERNPVTLQRLCVPVVFSRKNVWMRKHQRCGR